VARALLFTGRTTIFREAVMKELRKQGGKLGWILLWAIGVPVPILLVLFLLRGCT
jgi:hypothetical protein